MKKADFLPFLYTAYDDVTEFCKTFDSPWRKTWADASRGGLVLGANLVQEEFNELLDATSPEEELDARCDLLYVLLFSMHMAGENKDDLTKLNFHSLPPYPGEVGSVIKHMNEWPCCFRRLFDALPNAIGGLTKQSAEKFYLFGSAFRAVHLNNMDKLWPEKSNDPTHECKLVRPFKWIVKRKSDGKVVKRPGHTKVNLTPFTGTRAAYKP